MSLPSSTLFLHLLQTFRSKTTRIRPTQKLWLFFSLACHGLGEYILIPRAHWPCGLWLWDDFGKITAPPSNKHRPPYPNILNISWGNISQTSLEVAGQYCSRPTGNDYTPAACVPLNSQTIILRVTKIFHLQVWLKNIFKKSVVHPSQLFLCPIFVHCFCSFSCVF